MTTWRILRQVKYVGPVLFLLGLAYTTLYPERKLLAASKSKPSHPVTVTTPFDGNPGSSPSNLDEISLTKCRVRNVDFVKHNMGGSPGT